MYLFDNSIRTTSELQKNLNKVTWKLFKLIEPQINTIKSIKRNLKLKWQSFLVDLL